jgi:hypothetical protein
VPIKQIVYLYYRFAGLLKQHHRIIEELIQYLFFNQTLYTMKTKAFILACLLIGIGLTNLSAQNNRIGSFVIRGPIEYWTVAECQGVIVDYIQGVIECHWVFHVNYDTGEIEWFIGSAHGKATGLSGETFRVMEMDQFLGPNVNIAEMTSTAHINLKGDRGHHYILSGVLDLRSNTYSFDKAICLESGN